MELDVRDKICGQIWCRTPNNDKDGLLITLKHSSSSGNIRFLKACFDSSSDQFIAGDHLGNIFLFDLTKNRFSLVQKIGQPATAIAFGINHRNEFLVGLDDGSFKCFDIYKGHLTADMKGHRSAIHSISVHMSGNYAVTTSSETTYLWDLNTFQKKHKLSIKEDVDLLQAFFLPNCNTVMTCFCDDTIFAWDLLSLTCKYQLPVRLRKSPQYKVFAAAPYSHYLIAGGKSRFLHLWNLDTQRLIRVIEMPTKVKVVKQLEFLNICHDGIDQVLGVLSQDGILWFISIVSCKLMFSSINVDSTVLYMAFGPDVHHFVTLMENGKLHIYSAHALISALIKPLPPLLKVAASGCLSRATRTECSFEKAESLQKPSKVSHKCFGLKNKGNDDENLETGGLKKEKLLTILKNYGEYPAKYRVFIWRTILQLPDNFSAYAALVDKGVHPAFSKLHDIYPIKSHQLLRVLQRILSALAHWSPIFGETQYLPSFVFPFIRLYQNNHLVCFELVATVLANWSQHWFEYYPNPPIYILGLIENLLAHHDMNLLQHFIKCGITSQIYAWQLLETAFSEVLSQDEWLMLWDNILSNHPAFLIMIVVAYNICARGPLMKCTNIADFQFFFHHRNALSVKRVVYIAYHLLEASSSDVHPQDKLDAFVPLTKGNYPVFNKFPKFVVDYQAQVRERISKEELEFLKQKNVTLDMQKEILQRHEKEEQWHRQHRLLHEVEDKRKKMVQEEESKFAEQKTCILAKDQELHMAELPQLETQTHEFLQFQTKQSEVKLKCLDVDLHKIALQQHLETKTASQESEITNIEFQLKKNSLDQKRKRIEAHDTTAPKELITTETEYQPFISFPRKTSASDGKEASLLHEVRVLRQRLAVKSRNKQTPLPV